MAWPRLATAIFRGIMQPEMVTSLPAFLDQLGPLISGRAHGRHAEIQWWSRNAPWLPGADLVVKISD